MTSPRPNALVLGAGFTGLAAAYYAKKSGLSAKVLEAADRIGGNCATLSLGDFRFDTGAHRLHDRDPEITAELGALLGDDLQAVKLGSRIYDDGKFVDFPLSPLNLAVSLGLPLFTRAGLEVLAARLKKIPDSPSFQDVALGTYGKTIADRFLLNYSGKLWGVDCSELSPKLAGGRLKGLNLSTFVREFFLGRFAKTRHLDGAFLYPRTGIGAITERLAEHCDAGAITTGSAVTGLRHDGERIVSVTTADNVRHEADHVVSTIPLDAVVAMLDPPAPQEIMVRAEDLKYRHILLVVLLIDRESITDAATVYFPSADFPFTRAYEPRNRSESMSPAGQTSLVFEIPYSDGDTRWDVPDEEVVSQVRDALESISWINGPEVLGSCVHRLPRAYPLLTMRSEESAAAVRSYFGRFSNLHVGGRVGEYGYVSMHTLMQSARAIVRSIVEDGSVA